MDGKDEALPLGGYVGRRTSIPGIEALDDAKLAEVNALLPWAAYIIDSKGRRFGNQASPTKRSTPNHVPDPRIVELNKMIPLKDKSVLEIGCFEGIHTAALAQFGAEVWGCDARVVNIMKSAVRCAFLQVHAKFFAWDVEEPLPANQVRDWDVLHHIGVLYHLLDPVGHLQHIAPRIKQWIILDTHVATGDQATLQDTANGFTYRYKTYKEPGYEFVFAGTRNEARWLHVDDLTELLKQLGFTNQPQVELREERNGPRVLIYASRG